ncbi:hypothetical protein GOP47_0027459 [Adiantum capillus-veneris]|nr:hypothetical protein GOP47_0027459 [Adiantum capillus-veneris]
MALLISCWQEKQLVDDCCSAYNIQYGPAKSSKWLAAINKYPKSDSGSLQSGSSPAGESATTGSSRSQSTRMPGFGVHPLPAVKENVRRFRQWVVTSGSSPAGESATTGSSGSRSTQMPGFGVHPLPAVKENVSLLLPRKACDQARYFDVVLGCDCLVFGKGWLLTNTPGFWLAIVAPLRGFHYAFWESFLHLSFIQENILITTLIGQPNSTPFMDHNDNELDSSLLDCVIRIQSLCDQHRTSVKFQDDLLRILFEGLDPTVGKKMATSSEKKCLASLLVCKPSNWNGRLGDKQIPCNFSQLLHMYKEKGMVSPQEWKLCVGTEDTPHSPQVFEPSMEDAYEGVVLKCRCNMEEGNEDGDYPKKCEDWHSRCIMRASSERKAQDAWNACRRLLPGICKHLIDKKGIVVGGNKKKFFTLNGFEKESLLAIYNWMHPFSNTSKTIHCGGVLCSKAFLHECRYAVDDYVVFEDQLLEPNRSEEIIRRGHLKKLFLHEQEGEIQLFMNVEALLQRDFIMDEVESPSLWAHDHHANALWLDWKLIVSVLPSSSIEVARDEDLNS